MDSLSPHIRARTAVWLAPLLVALALAAFVAPRSVEAQATGDGLPASVEAAVRAAAAAEAGVDADDVSILRAEAVTWNDGCLGVSQAGTACTQALVPGYAVWVEAGGTVYRYHTNTTSTVILGQSGIAAGSVATAPLPAGATARSGAITGEVPPEGVALLVPAEELTPEGLVEALRSQGCDPVSIAITVQGSFVTYIPGAPAFVNVSFPATLDAGTPFSVRCRPTSGGDGDDGAFSAQPIDETARGGIGVFTDVTVGEHEGFDRIVFEFAAEFEGLTLAPGVPGYSIEYVDAEQECGSGFDVVTEGSAMLRVNFPQAYVYNPNTGEGTLDSLEMTADHQVILEVEETCGFEGQATWIIGTTGEQPFRVFELSSPTRLVIDIATAP